MSFAARRHLSVAAAQAEALGVLQLMGDSYDNVGITESVSLTFNTDGTLSHTNTFDDPANTVPTHWYAPTTGGIGAGYQVRFTKQSGTSWDGTPTNGVLYALSSARTLTWSLAYGGNAAASVLVEILTAGGAPYKSGLLTVALYNDEF